jgi:N-acetylglucosaminyl-diphospho-decaprenol L-rhamnosyltransferase
VRTFPDLVDAVGHGLFGMVAPNNRFTRRYRLLDWDHRQPARVDWVSGACFLVRREAWDAVGGFDPSYFMYMEDVDLCWRLGRAGWAVGYQPAAGVLHVQGVSANRHPYRMLAAHHHSMWRFAWRTTRGAKRAALPVVAFGLVGRLAVATVEHRLGDPGRPRLPIRARSTGGRPPRPLP